MSNHAPSCSHHDHGSDGHICGALPGSGVTQTIDEMKYQRGVWGAVMCVYLIDLFGKCVLCHTFYAIKLILSHYRDGNVSKLRNELAKRVCRFLSLYEFLSFVHSYFLILNVAK